MIKPWISVTIPANAEYVDIVRLALYGVANKAGFSYEDIEDMKVAVTEACNNVVLHAYDGNQVGMIEIVFEVQRDLIRIRVKDSGSSFPYQQTVNKVTSLHNKPLREVNAGGLGLFMMHALMDRVEVHTDIGTEVILTKRIGRKEEMA